MYSHSILKKLSAREGFDFDYKYTEMHSKFYRTVLIHRNISKKSIIAVHRKGLPKNKKITKIWSVSLQCQDGSIAFSKCQDVCQWTAFIDSRTRTTRNTSLLAFMVRMRSCPLHVKAAKYEIQKPSTCRATLFRCKFSSMFPVFHLARSTCPATKTFVATKQCYMHKKLRVFVSRISTH